MPRNSVAPRRAIVHAGVPRTGTTSLQRVLTRLRPELLEAGVLYPLLTPRSAGCPHLSHQHLGEALDGRRPPRERAELLDDLSGQLAATSAGTVLLSYEGFCLAPARRGAARRLAALFARHGFAMELLATVKPQAEQVNSSYTWRMQFLREQRPFGDYFRSAFAEAALDLARLLDPWRAACDGRVTAVPVRGPRSDRPLVERVFAELGLPCASLLAPADVALVENRSPGPVAVEAMRRLRRGGAHRAGLDARDVTRFVERQAAARGLDAARFQGLDDEMRDRARARWDAANDRFARRVWNQAWDARVAEAPASPPNELARLPDAREAGREAGAIVREACARFEIALRPQTAPAARLGLALRGLRAAPPRGGS